MILVDKMIDELLARSIARVRQTRIPEWRCSVERNILAQMMREYDSFTRSERKIVDYVLEHQKETQYISITDLSNQCGVAVSTVSLFCRKLKLAGFNDFKLELARALCWPVRRCKSPRTAGRSCPRTPCTPL